jgi:hypothetical protein
MKASPGKLVFTSQNNSLRADSIFKVIAIDFASWSRNCGAVGVLDAFPYRGWVPKERRMLLLSVETRPAEGKS